MTPVSVWLLFGITGKHPVRHTKNQLGQPAYDEDVRQRQANAGQLRELIQGNGCEQYPTKECKPQIDERSPDDQAGEERQGKMCSVRALGRAGLRFSGFRGGGNERFRPTFLLPVPTADTPMHLLRPALK